MEREITIYGGLEVVVKDDYLKVVEELNRTKERLERVVESKDITNDKLRLAIKEKDEEIELLKTKETDIIHQMSELTNFICVGNKYNKGRVGMRTSDAIIEIIEEKDGEIERLKINIEDRIELNNWNVKTLTEKINKLEDKYIEEELWTLKYIYDVNGVVKEYEQNGMIKEDAEELIGMDSDNWNHWSLTKEERADKDKIIEGLLIRCESNEELIKELEDKIEGIEIENRQLANDHRLKIGLSDRRA